MRDYACKIFSTMPGIKLLHIKLCVSFLFFPKTRIGMQLSREEEAALKKFYFKHLFPALPCIYLKGEQRGKSGMFCTLLLQFFLPSRASPHVTTQLKLALNILSCRGDFYDAPSHSLIPQTALFGQLLEQWTPAQGTCAWWSWCMYPDGLGVPWDQVPDQFLDEWVGLIHLWMSSDYLDSCNYDWMHR